MNTDKELKKIITQALPEVSCPVSNQNVLARRVWLESKILSYLNKRCQDLNSTYILNGSSLRVIKEPVADAEMLS